MCATLALFGCQRPNWRATAPHLIGMEREALADAAGVHVNPIRKMEVKGAAEITSGADTARWVQDAPESAGVELLVHGRPGVRLRKHPGGQQSRKKAPVLPCSQRIAVLFRTIEIRRGHSLDTVASKRCSVRVIRSSLKGAVALRAT